MSLSRRAFGASLATALGALASACSSVSDGSESAGGAITPAPGDAMRGDRSFVYETGDHLEGGSWRPTDSVYADRSGRPMYLIGDSMAAQLATPMREAAQAHGYAFKPRSKATVSFTLPVAGPSMERRWRQAVLDEITADRNRDPLVVVTGQQMGTVKEITRTVEELRAVGAEVRLVTVTPAPETDVPPQVAEHGPGYRWTPRHWGRSRSAMLVAGRRAHPHVPVLDLQPLVARDREGDSYASVVDGVLVFGPGSHLTDTFATRFLADPLEEFTARDVAGQ
ncbi:SGNH hydrolase domain-containing protein [Janibacter anophelis]|uniref:SGNH hydrolase domain-containing protein n=1 Tax=Janibacter anophelis TaxID=319054 RepID=UPI003F81E2CF